MASGELIVLDDYATWPQRLGELQEHMHASATLPLTPRDQIIRVMGLTYADPAQKFDESRQEVLKRFGQFGQLAAIACDNAQHFEDVQQSQLGPTRG